MVRYEDIPVMYQEFLSMILLFYYCFFDLLVYSFID